MWKRGTFKPIGGVPVTPAAPPSILPIAPAPAPTPAPAPAGMMHLQPPTNPSPTPSLGTPMGGDVMNGTQNRQFRDPRPAAIGPTSRSFFRV